MSVHLSDGGLVAQEVSNTEVVAQAELLFEQRQQRQAIARERDLIENAWAAFLCRRRLRAQQQLMVTYRTARASLNVPQLNQHVQQRLMQTHAPPPAGVQLFERIFDIL